MNTIRKLLILLSFFALFSCKDDTSEGYIPPPVPPQIDEKFLDEMQRSHFNFFWNLTNTQNGLVPDRATRSSNNYVSSIAATGFGLTAYIVGAERGYVTREQAAQRTLTTLRFFKNAPMGDAASGTTGYKGFFYHFLDRNTGLRAGQNELSTIDTGLLIAGVLSSQTYFDHDNAIEKDIRELADDLYRAVDWKWAMNNGSLMSLGWSPEEGFLSYTWTGYNEAMILYILAAGSPEAETKVPGSVWNKWTSTYNFATFQGYEMVNFSPLFGHQYSHMWVDFAGIKDAYMSQRGFDYFENSRRATLANRRYCIENPGQYAGYGETLWGLTACDGPGQGVYGKWGYKARGASAAGIDDDGTIAPTAAGGSFPFTPEESYAALVSMRAYKNGALYSEYGFHDAFNQSENWIAESWLGIDQGPILIMIENYRSKLIWNLMKKNPYIVNGLKEVGFTGGWLR